MNPGDFAAHEPPRASGKYPRLERRKSVIQSHCGRRTSLVTGQLYARRLAVSILPSGPWILRDSVICNFARDTPARLFFYKQPEQRAYFELVESLTGSQDGELRAVRETGKHTLVRDAHIASGQLRNIPRDHSRGSNRQPRIAGPFRW